MGHILRVFATIILVGTGIANKLEETCSKSSCNVMTFLEHETNKTNQLVNTLDRFFSEKDLGTSQESMENLKLSLEADSKMGLNVSLFTYLLRYQNYHQEEMKKLNHEIEINFTNTLEDHAVYISQIMTDVEKIFLQKFNQQNKTITEAVNNIETKILKIIEDQLENNTQAIKDMENRITQRLEDITMKENDNSTQCKNVKDNFRPTDCMDLRLCAGERKSGIYTIYPTFGCAYMSGISVYCDMEIDNGGWTVFLSRQKQTIQEDFNRPWLDYKEGFGNPTKEYWLGNEILHLMTSSKDYTLRIDTRGPGFPWNTWGKWSHFKVESENAKYRLNLSGFNGNSTMVDSFAHVSDRQFFSTLDRDNDNWYGNCAKNWGGGFWFKACYYHNPTAPFEKMQFRPWSSTDSSPRYAVQIQMKIRPRSRNLN